MFEIPSNFAEDTDIAINLSVLRKESVKCLLRDQEHGKVLDILFHASRLGYSKLACFILKQYNTDEKLKVALLQLPVDSKAHKLVLSELKKRRCL